MSDSDVNHIQQEINRLVNEAERRRAYVARLEETATNLGLLVEKIAAETIGEVESGDPLNPPPGLMGAHLALWQAVNIWRSSPLSGSRTSVHL
jgi:hypothetical protein